MRWIWVDRVVELETGARLVAVKNVSLAEDHLHDHFAASESGPAEAIMPASLILEGMAQSAGILVGHAERFKEKVILAKVTRFELERDVTPGCTIRYTATLDQIGASGASTSGVIEVLDHARAGEFERIGRAQLVFSHLDQNLAGTAYPEHNFVFGETFKDLLRNSGVEWESRPADRPLDSSPAP